MYISLYIYIHTYIYIYNMYVSTYYICICVYRYRYVLSWYSSPSIIPHRVRRHCLIHREVVSRVPKMASSRSSHPTDKMRNNHCFATKTIYIIVWWWWHNIILNIFFSVNDVYSRCSSIWRVHILCFMANWMISSLRTAIQTRRPSSVASVPLGLLFRGGGRIGVQLLKVQCVQRSTRWSFICIHMF